jgi:cytochrome c553
MVGKSKGFFVASVGLAIGLSLCGSLPAAAQGIEEKTQVCAGCHGADGKPIDKTTPVIWGQQQGYLYIQLRDFKRNDRKNEIMQPIASAMERQDMMDIAEYFSKKPWPDLGQPRAPKDVSE